MYNAPAYRNDFNDYNILTMDKYYFDEEVKTYDEFLKDKKFILTDTLTVSTNGVVQENGITKEEVENIINGNHAGYSYMDYDEFYGVILLSNTEITSTNYPEHYKYKLRSHIKELQRWRMVFLTIIMFIQ